LARTVARATVSCQDLYGLLAALGDRPASVAASQGNGAIFTVFAAAVIGGASLNGGKRTMFGAFTGMLWSGSAFTTTSAPQL